MKLLAGWLLVAADWLFPETPLVSDSSGH